MVNAIAHQLLTQLDCGEPAIWVCVAETKGSVPRERGASMIVTQTELWGTIGGGHLELNSVEVARALLAAQQITATKRHFPLGPALGQCCGGVVDVAFLPLSEHDRSAFLRLKEIEQQGGELMIERALDAGNMLRLPLVFSPWRVCVFGAGHVGAAIVAVLAALPCEIRWIDSRDAVFPSRYSGNVRIVETDDPAFEARGLPANADVLVLTHSHALDLDICLALIERDDLAYIGLIGSPTKAATFRKRFAQRGVSVSAMARINCPIGMAQLTGKHPGVIAVGVAADLIARRQIVQGKRIERDERSTAA